MTWIWEFGYTVDVTCCRYSIVKCLAVITVINTHSKVYGLTQSHWLIHTFVLYIVPRNITGYATYYVKIDTLSKLLCHHLGLTNVFVIRLISVCHRYYWLMQSNFLDFIGNSSCDDVNKDDNVWKCQIEITNRLQIIRKEGVWL